MSLDWPPSRSVDVDDALVNPSKTDDEVAQTVVDLGDKGTSDGMESDAEGKIYFGDVETNSIRRRLPDENYELLAQTRAFSGRTHSLW